LTIELQNPGWEEVGNPAHPLVHPPTQNTTKVAHHGSFGWTGEELIVEPYE